MFKKITVVVFMLAIGLVIYQVLKFNNGLAVLSATDTKGIEPFIENYSNEICIGNMLALVLLLLCNITAITTKTIGWIFLPFIIFACIQLVNAYEGETLFHYKKSVGLWNGSFSLGPIAAFILIALAALVIFINYTILKNYLKKKSANNLLRS